MSKRYFIAALAIAKIDDFYLKIHVGNVDYLVHGDDLYFALIAALAGQAESIPALASTTTDHGQNQPKKGTNQ